MKFLVCLLMLIYVISPIDIMPGVPLDDLIAAVGTIAYLLKPKKEET